jgi:DNA gyrase/topoisomerase IV subunit B
VEHPYKVGKEEQRIPLYRIKTDKGEFFRFEDEGIEELLEDSTSERLQLLLEETEEQAEHPNEVGEAIIEDVSDMPEIRELNKLMANLRRYDVLPSDFQTNSRNEINGERSNNLSLSFNNPDSETDKAAVVDSETDALFTLNDGDNGQRSANSVWELLDQMLEIGRRGITIYRYKGLAEMSADQLRETVMDPNE